MAARVIGVIGVGTPDEKTDSSARRVGRLLAEQGCVVITGGLGGVMQAASQGASEAGGLVIGVLPGASPDEANRYVGVAVATGMGDARNAILANSAEAFVAVGGSYGTLSEIAFVLKRGKRIVSLGSWNVDPQILSAADPEQAVQLVLS